MDPEPTSSVSGDVTLVDGDANSPSCRFPGFHGNLSGLYAWLFLCCIAASVVLNVCLIALAIRQCFNNRQLRRQGQYQANPDAADTGCRFVFDNCAMQDAGKNGGRASQLLSVVKTGAQMSP